MTTSHPVSAGMPQPTQPEKEKNTLGIIALVCAIAGFVFSCIPGALIVGWILLPIGFILGIVALFFSGKKKGSAIAAVVISVVGTVVAAIVMVFVIDKAFDEAFDSTGTAPSEENGAVAADTGDDEQGSTRENPLPVGSTVEDDEWAYTINSVNLNATEEVMAANSYNEAPGEGQAYALVNITATYKGNDPAGSFPAGTVDFVTPEGTTVHEWDSNVLPPESFNDAVATLYEGASVTGNYSYIVSAANGSEGVLAVSPGLISDKKFVAVQ